MDFQYSILNLSDADYCKLSLLVMHIVKPGFRGSSSHAYLILNGIYFSYLVSQQPLLSYASLRLKKKKKGRLRAE